MILGDDGSQVVQGSLLARLSLGGILLESLRRGEQCLSTGTFASCHPCIPDMVDCQDCLQSCRFYSCSFHIFYTCGFRFSGGGGTQEQDLQRIRPWSPSFFLRFDFLAFLVLSSL